MMHTSAEAIYQQAQRHLSAVPPDYAQAVPLLQQAAHDGHAEAAFQLAGCLINGQGIAADFGSAVLLLKQAARGGHAYARYNLLQLQESEGMPCADLVPAYEEIARQGMVHAQLRLMRFCSEQGEAGQALAWACLAAAQNHPQAQYFLAQHYQYAAEPNLVEAHRLYHLAAEQGFVAAHWQLGLQYRHGQGTAADLTRAAEHLAVAAQHDIVPAQTALAQILLPTDPSGALRWFQTAAAHGDDDAHAALAECYLTGKHLPRDAEAARKHAEAAAQNRHAEALRLLGDIYRYGLGVAAQPDQAREYYRQAADLGSLVAHQKLLSDSVLNQKGDYEQTKAAALQRQQAENLYQQGFAAHYGLRQAQDYLQALACYRKAAQSGHSKAQTNLGMMYSAGQGVAADYAEAARWFEKAAAARDSMAQYNLACLYFHGMGVAADKDKACYWLQQAIDNGHEQSDVLRQLLQQWQNA